MVDARVEELELPARENDSARMAAVNELHGIFRATLRDEDARLIDQCSEGKSWSQVGTDFNSTPDAVRMRATRLFDRLKAALDSL